MSEVVVDLKAAPVAAALDFTPDQVAKFLATVYQFADVITKATKTEWDDSLVAKLAFVKEPWFALLAVQVLGMFGKGEEVSQEKLFAAVAALSAFSSAAK